MALFKILRGKKDNLLNQDKSNKLALHDGWAYFTTDDQKFYIDANLGTEKSPNVKRLNIHTDHADNADIAINYTTGKGISPIKDYGNYTNVDTNATGGKKIGTIRLNLTTTDIVCPLARKAYFSMTTGQNKITIPFEFDLASNLTVFYNGLLLKPDENYTISSNIITLGFTAEDGDIACVMGIDGATSVGLGANAQTWIDEIKAVENQIANVVKKNEANTITANGKITMASTYVPSGSKDVAVKDYVDSKISTSVNNVIGSNSDSIIYIGTSPSSKALIWIDTSSTGFLKYRASAGATWLTVPIGWVE